MKWLVTSLLVLHSFPLQIASPVKTERRPGQGPVLVFGAGLSTPESVLYDPVADEYLVSNMNGSPVAKDNNGFITVLSPDGRVRAAKFIEGGKNGVSLDAPKGMAISGNKIFVADIDTLRVFDRRTGKKLADIAVPGATFLNDVSAAPDGTVFFTDSGYRQGPKQLDPSGSDAVYAFQDGTLQTLVKDATLGHPNGIIATGLGVWVVNAGNNELWAVDLKNAAKGEVTHLPKGNLDGMAVLANGELLVSSWDGKAIFRGRPGQEFKEVLSTPEVPGDIGLDTRRNRLLVPLFLYDRIEVWDLTGLTAEASAR